MNWRKHLRDRLDVTQLDGPNAPKVTDEEILNVLRRADDEYLSTTEIKEELPIGDQTSNRLNALGTRIASSNERWGRATSGSFIRASQRPR